MKATILLLALMANPTFITIERVLPTEGRTFLLETEEGDLITVLGGDGLPAPALGLARKPHNLAIIQNGYRYTISGIVYHQDREYPVVKPHPKRRAS